jgi:metal-responsive CopG/Arc/MetJ family transcriptional regulator
MNSMLHVKLPDELLQRIVEYWHERRLASRSEAIRELLEAALDAAKPAKIRKAS